MPSYHAHVLVLKKTKLGETDVICTLLSADGSQLRAVAKGARKPTSKMCGLTEPFCVLDALLYTGRNLDVIRDATLTHANAALRSDYDKLQPACVVLDFLAQSTEVGEYVPRLFDLTLATLDVMASAPPDRCPQLMVAFLLKAMAMLGYSPQYDICAKHRWLGQLFVSTMAQVADFDIPQRTRDVLPRYVTQFVRRHMPARIRTLDAYS
ncbi:MAG: DNA repair protein RecO [Actinomycetes bacterium]|jgi:DNA repair protein RecO (recombination protein O)|nr:DNA repair protein RecO [Actinomycetes bacterium]